MYLTILWLPLLAGILCGGFGRLVGRSGAIFISLAFNLIALFLSIIVFYETAILNQIVIVKVFKWICFSYFNTYWGFYFDRLVSLMCVVVFSVSLLVQLYSVDYMKDDPHIQRFMSYLSLFTFFMILLCAADNFLILFVGWEGVGLCSYLLISFWYTRLQASLAALKAFIVNRIGDLFFLTGLALLSSFNFTLNYNICFLIVDNTYVSIFGHWINVVELVAVLLFIGAMSKSAQIFLHTWLPDAMEGPTPVSALIHAATMVAAGVFLVIKCSIIFEHAPKTLSFIAFIGATTAFVAASIGLVQNDIKRVIAYSTCSQLGYMFFIAGLSGYINSLFHLTNHAFFKALLFLATGSVIHSLSDSQDIRRMGAVIKFLPVTYVTFLVGSLALSGFLFLSGYYSKDFIVEMAYVSTAQGSYYCFILGILAAFCTSFYSLRLLYMVFIVQHGGFQSNFSNCSESSWIILIVLLLLAFLSIFTGFFLKDFFAGIGEIGWSQSIYVIFLPFSSMDVEIIPYYIKLAPIVFSLFGLFIALLSNEFFVFVSGFNKFVLGGFTFFLKKWFFDQIYNFIFIDQVVNFAYVKIYKFIDRGFLELAGPAGIAYLVETISMTFKKLHTGFLIHYVLYFTYAIFIFFYFFSIYWFIPYSTLSTIAISLVGLIAYFLSEKTVPYGLIKLSSNVKV